MDNRNVETDEGLEAVLQSAFDETAASFAHNQRERLTRHAVEIGSRRRIVLFTVPRLAMAAAALLVLVVGLNLNTDEDEASSRETQMETAAVAPRAPSLTSTADPNLDLTEDEEDLAYDTYLDMGFESDESDLSLLDSPIDGLNEQELITVYDTLLNRGG